MYLYAYLYLYIRTYFIPYFVASATFPLNDCNISPSVIDLVGSVSRSNSEGVYNSYPQALGPMFICICGTCVSVYACMCVCVCVCICVDIYM